MGRKKQVAAIPLPPTVPWLSRTPNEVWVLIRDQIACEDTLFSLVQVCKKFRTIFEPALYRTMVIHLSDVSPQEASTKQLWGGIEHMKELEFRIQRSDKAFYKPKMNNDYALFVKRVLDASSELRSFKWVDDTYHYHYAPSAILRKPGILETLKVNPTLQKVSLQFQTQYLNEEALEIAAKKWFCPLVGFHDLTSLELYDIYGPKTKLVNEIAKVLQDCPHLKTLALGMGVWADCRMQPETVNVEEDRQDFLEQLALKYASLDTEPLKLQKLRLAYGIHLYPSTDPEMGNYLAKLLDVRPLQILHLFNGPVALNEEDGKPQHIEWTLFDGCQSLRQLSVFRLTPSTVDWLNSNGQSVSELIISDIFSYHTHGLREYRKLRLPHLSMLKTQQGHIVDCDCDEYCDCECEEGYCDDEYKVDVGSSDAIFLKSSQTVLDRLWDNGVQLTRLCLPLLLERQWEKFKTSIRDLTHLRDLFIDSPRGVFLYPNPAASLWPALKHPQDIAHAYGLLLHKLCPSLQRIRIGSYAWRVEYNVPPSHGRITRNWEAVTLQEISTDEINEIETFQKSAPTQSGLLGPPESFDGTELPDEVLREVERRREHREQSYQAGMINVFRLMLNDSDSSEEGDSEGEGQSESESEGNEDDEDDTNEYGGEE